MLLHFIGQLNYILYTKIGTSVLVLDLQLQTQYNYRRLSLPQSPGDQTKYFEISVVRDSQFVTSFTLYMYMDYLDHRDYNLHVQVFGNDIFEFKYLLTELLIVILIFRRLRPKLKNVDDYLHQRTPLNNVQTLKLQRRRYVHSGYNLLVCNVNSHQNS